MLSASLNGFDIPLTVPNVIFGYQYAQIIFIALSQFRTPDRIRLLVPAAAVTFKTNFRRNKLFEGHGQFKFLAQHFSLLK